MNDTIVAPKGSFLSAAVISVDDLEGSLQFYRDLIGLDAHDPITWQGPAFEAFWHLPSGSSARSVFLSTGPDPVGRVLLLKFSSSNQYLIRNTKSSRAYGLFNLNFYTSDIYRETKKFKKLGYEFWSEPKKHSFKPNVGTPIEVVFEGPDGVLINWVELATKDPNTRIGQMSAYVDSFGYTPTGFTPVVTTASCMRDIEKSTTFYRQVLNMDVLIDEILESKEYREFQRVPDGGRTKIRFVQGNHMFGKIAMSEPINYNVEDLVPRAIAPNIGYLAQIFEVDDLGIAEKVCLQLSVEIYSKRTSIFVPGFGKKDTILVRNPGSGALQQLIQR